MFRVTWTRMVHRLETLTIILLYLPSSNKLQFSKYSECWYSIGDGASVVQEARLNGQAQDIKGIRARDYVHRV